jgi:YVTN family beta-propeller protein
MLPVGVVATPGAVLVSNHHSDSVSVINPKTNKITKTISVGLSPTGGPAHMAALGHTAWVGVPDASAVAEIDLTRQKVVLNAKVPTDGVCGDIAASEQAVWVGGGGCGLGIARIDVTTGKVAVKAATTWEVASVLLWSGSLWYTKLGGAGIKRIDPATDQPLAGVTANGAPTALAAGFGALWATDPPLRALLRVTGPAITSTTTQP